MLLRGAAPRYGPPSASSRTSPSVSMRDLVARIRGFCKGSLAKDNDEAFQANGKLTESFELIASADASEPELVKVYLRASNTFPGPEHLELTVRESGDGMRRQGVVVDVALQVGGREWYAEKNPGALQRIRGAPLPRRRGGRRSGAGAGGATRPRRASKAGKTALVNPPASPVYNWAKRSLAPLPAPEGSSTANDAVATESAAASASAQLEDAPQPPEKRRRSAAKPSLGPPCASPGSAEVEPAALPLQDVAAEVAPAASEAHIARTPPRAVCNTPPSTDSATAKVAAASPKTPPPEVCNTPHVSPVGAGSGPEAAAGRSGPDAAAGPAPASASTGGPPSRERLAWSAKLAVTSPRSLRRRRSGSFGFGPEEEVAPPVAPQPEAVPPPLRLGARAPSAASTANRRQPPLLSALRSPPATLRSSVYSRCSSSLSLEPQLARAGLPNLGNTCYLNAVLQAIASLREFCAALRALPADAFAEAPPNLAQSPAAARRRPGTVAPPLLEVLRQLGDASRERPDASRLRAAVALASPAFGGDEQQDAHEFFIELVNIVHDELLTALDPYMPLPTQCFFHAQVMKRLTCTECGKHRDVWEFFRDFSLDFPGAGPCSVGDMVRAYFEREQITATCEACGATSASMSKHLEASPQVLVLHLKRFVPNMQLRSYEKRSERTRIPLQLDLSACGVQCHTPPSSHRPARYELRAAIAHEGSTPNSGHYVTYSLAAEGRWRVYDDAAVREVSGSVEDQLACGAYLLFYVAADGRKLSSGVD